MIMKIIFENSKDIIFCGDICNNYYCNSNNDLNIIIIYVKNKKEFIKKFDLFQLNYVRYNKFFQFISWRYEINIFQFKLIVLWYDNYFIWYQKIKYYEDKKINIVWFDVLIKTYMIFYMLYKYVIVKDIYKFFWWNIYKLIEKKNEF